MASNESVVPLTDFAVPSTSKQVPEPSISKQVSEPSTSKLVSEPSTSKLVSEPSTSKLVSEPSTSKLVSEPSTSKLVSEPSTSKQVSEPSTPKQVSEPSTSKQVPKMCPPKYSLSLATKLLFSDSLNNILIGKRKAISEDNVNMPEKRTRTEAISTLASATSEARRLKIDLIATKAQVAMLETQVNQQRTKRMEMQILFEEEKASLMTQHKSDERAVSNMADRLEMIKRRERDLMEDYDQEKREHKQYKANWDTQKAVLQKKIADMKDNLLECTASSQQQISEMKKDMDELLLGLESSQSEVEILKAEVERQTNIARTCTTLKNALEKQTFELQSVTMKLRELEYEKDSYIDWQQQAKTAQWRLTNMAELEKEVARLRAQEKDLRDCIVNKLLLEEQVHVLESKVNAIRPMQDELHAAKVKVASLELALGKWKAAVSPHGIETPESLTATLDTVLSSHLDATVATSATQLRVTQLSEELESVKFERNKANSKVEELLLIRNHHEGLIDRLEKKQQLISYDRDSYRLLLDSYEKELAVTQSGAQGSDSLELLKIRVEQQEQSLQRYRDLLIKYDPKEQTKLVASLHTESGKRREQIEFLNHEVERIRRHRNSLLVHLERIGAQS